MLHQIVTLRVFLYGLIALVTPGDRPDPLTILVLDARNPPHATDGCPIQPHSPELVYDADVTECEDPCYPNKGVCRCDLDRVSIELPPPRLSPNVVIGDACAMSAQAAGKSRQLGGPFDDLPRYVPSMHCLRFLLGGLHVFNKIRPDCLPQADAKKFGCPIVVAAARELQPSSIRSCRLASMGEEQTYEVGSSSKFRFHPLTRRRWFPHQQSISHSLLVTEEIEVADPSYVPVKIKAFDENESFAIKLKTQRCPIDDGQHLLCADLILSNRELEGHGEALFGRCAERSSGRHFELYYDLMNKPKLLMSRLIPTTDSSAPYSPVPMDAHQEAYPECVSTLTERYDAIFDRNGTVHSVICPQAQITSP